MSFATERAVDGPPTAAGDTAWRAGRLDARPGRRRILFGQVYEDAAVECDAFAPGSRVFCIASAGCTALALSRDHEVVACDINPAQIEYVYRRMNGGGRETGTADRVMQLLRALMPLAGWTRATIGEFLALGDPDLQLDFWRERLNTRRLRVGMDVMLSPLWLRSIYAPALLACLPGRFGAVLRARMERCFARHPNRENPYAHMLLQPDRELLTLPGPAGSAAERIELVATDAAACLETCPPGSFAGFSLSNILDGATDSYRGRLFAAVARAASPGARVVLRSFAEPPPGLTTNRAEYDRSMLWGVVDVRPVETLGQEPMSVA